MTLPSNLVLHNYWRSSCSWRVRIGLNLKGIAYEYAVVNLLEGQQLSDEHAARNPAKQVPTLTFDLAGASHTVTQSVAILELLDELVPSPALLPSDPVKRAHTRALTQLVNSGIQPLQNLAVINHIRDELGGARKDWGHWAIKRGLVALEAAAQPHAGRFMVGDSVTMADLFLVPQLFNGRRFDVDIDEFPLLAAIEANCAELPPFVAAHPSVQPDATGS